MQIPKQKALRLKGKKKLIYTGLSMKGIKVVVLSVGIGSSRGPYPII